MNHSQRNHDNVTQAAVTAIAAASETPFKTAFKIYMGIALASIASAAILFSAFTAVIVLGFWIFN